MLPLVLLKKDSRAILAFVSLRLAGVAYARKRSHTPAWSGTPASPLEAMRVPCCWRRSGCAKRERTKQQQWSDSSCCDVGTRRGQCSAIDRTKFAVQHATRPTGARCQVETNGQLGVVFSCPTSISKRIRSFGMTRDLSMPFDTNGKPGWQALIRTGQRLESQWCFQSGGCRRLLCRRDKTRLLRLRRVFPRSWMCVCSAFGRRPAGQHERGRHR